MTSPDSPIIDFYPEGIFLLHHFSKMFPSVSGLESEVCFVLYLQTLRLT